MQLSVSIEREPFHSVCMKFSPENGDDLSPRAGSATYDALRETPVIVELLPGSPVSSVSDLHPDLIALGALLVCGQLKVTDLSLPVRPSDAMADAAREHFKLELHGNGVQHPPREFGDSPGLAFSGGVDSCAALLLMPMRTKSIFMHRFSLGEAKKTAYNANAALQSVAAVQRSARSAAVLRSNVETIRSPVGFPVDWSNALPLVFNADELDLASISFGTVLESASGLGKLKYSSLAKRTIYSRWAPVFQAAALSMSLPVAGLSEVLTSKIVRERGEFMLPQSCVRGEPGEPCRRCFKCFRKSLTEWALGGARMTDGDITFAATSREVSTRLRQVPIHHEIGFAWALANIESSNPLLRALKLRSDAYCDEYADLKFAETPYWHNFDLYIPVDLRNEVKTFAREAFGNEAAPGASLVERWDVQPVLESEGYKAGVSATIEELEVLSRTN